MKTTSTPLPSFEGVLSSIEQFKHDLTQYLPHPLTDEEEQALVEQARAGDAQACELLLLSLFPYMSVIACRLVRLSRWAGSRIEFLDLMQTGMLRAWGCLQRALTTHNPCAYLRVCVSHEIQREYHEQVSKLTSTDSLDVPLESNEDETWYDLLPEPIPVHEPERDFTPLYEAVKQLPKRKAETIMRNFGLEGEPETLVDIARSFQRPGTTTRAGNTPQLKKEALATLSQRLRVTVQRTIESTQDLYTVAQACAVLGINKTQLMYLKQKHHLPTFARGCYSKQAIDALAGRGVVAHAGN